MMNQEIESTRNPAGKMYSIALAIFLFFVIAFDLFSALFLFFMFWAVTGLFDWFFGTTAKSEELPMQLYGAFLILAVHIGFSVTVFFQKRIGVYGFYFIYLSSILYLLYTLIGNFYFLTFILLIIQLIFSIILIFLVRPKWKQFV
jgi:hypothetical protein